ncbi:uncharacterized protein LOC106166828 [Lingula anatina]|uniref:Uncharacterized protein LOC106166828 n=1 Tax=Lingula anatina TaxID=7574 RepID=A0A1S3IRV4_LINAN|nr:uncharacterized protein LOC106166828 [Lingula anatina]|eukprot:XP_013400937.1 uncharacterized protein LOC106166828 [Lingula anatina]
MSQYYPKLCGLVIDHGAQALRNYIQNNIVDVWIQQQQGQQQQQQQQPSSNQPSQVLLQQQQNLQQFLQAKKYILDQLYKNKKLLKKHQYDLLFPRQQNQQQQQQQQQKKQQQQQSNPNIAEFDITLLFFLIRQLHPNPPFQPNSKEWDVPAMAKGKPGLTADLEAAIHIKMYRNKFAHPKSTDMTQKDFEASWAEICQHIIQLGVPQCDLDALKVKSLDPALERSFVERIITQEKEDAEIKAILSQILELLKPNPFALPPPLQTTERTINQAAELTEAQLHQLQLKLASLYQKRYSRIPVIPFDPKETMDIEQIYIELRLLKDANSTLGHFFKPNIVPLNSYLDLFEIENGKSPRRIVVRGEPGSGKTTLSMRIVTHWANRILYLYKNEQSQCQSKENETFKDKLLNIFKPSKDTPPSLQMTSLDQFLLILPIYLRNVRENMTFPEILDENIFQEADLAPTGITLQDIWQFINSNPQSVLLVLDGYDELKSGSNADLEGIIQDSKMRDMTIITTTRNWKAEYLADKTKTDVHAEIAPMSRKHVQELTCKYFSILATAIEFKHGCWRKQTFTKDINEYASLIAACKFLNFLEANSMAEKITPLTLLYTCLLWQNGEEIHVPTTKAKLISAVREYSLLRYCEAQPDPSKAKEEVKKEILPKLQKMFFDSVLEDKFVFSTEEIDDERLFSAGLITQEVRVKPILPTLSSGEEEGQWGRYKCKYYEPVYLRTAVESHAADYFVQRALQNSQDPHVQKFLRYIKSDEGKLRLGKVTEFILEQAPSLSELFE